MGLLAVLRKDVERRDEALRTELMKLRNDDVIDKKKMMLRDVDDLYRIRDVAKDRVVWRRLFNSF